MADHEKRYHVRIFRDDSTTLVEYHNVKHVFWTADNTVLTVCLPDDDKHAQWPRERFCHFDVIGPL